MTDKGRSQPMADHAWTPDGWGNCAYCPREDDVRILPHPRRTHDFLGRPLSDDTSSQTGDSND